jgi:hypothetical protein
MIGVPVRVDLERRILNYLHKRPEGLSDAQLRAWVASCSRGGGYTIAEANDTLRMLRERGSIACTNGLWWIRTPLQNGPGQEQ